MSDDENFFEEDILKTGINKIKEILSGEIKLIRTILISCLTVIIICILLYFNYVLIGQFFTTIFLSFIVSLGLKPLKEKCLIDLTIYSKNRKYFTSNSTIVRIINWGIAVIKKLIDYILRLIRNNKIETSKDTQTSNRITTSVTSERTENSQDVELTERTCHETIFNDRNYLFSFCIFYCIIFKLEIYLSITLIFLYLLFDITLRIILDFIFSFIRFANKYRYFKNLFFENYQIGELNETVHSFISLIIISFFTITILLTILFFLWLLFVDFKSMVIYIKQNNDYRDYFINILPENIREYYKVDSMDNFYSNNVFVHLKTVEGYINSTLEQQFGDEILRGNYTLYDISNDVINFLKDPSLIMSSNHTISGYRLMGLLNEKCSKYEKEILKKVIYFTNVEYIRKFYCGVRILIDRFNLEFSMSIFSTYLKQGYKLFSKGIQLLSRSILLNILSLSLELINSVMLVFLFITCLYNFLKLKGDVIKDLLRFLPYPERYIKKIHLSFHNSMQGIFVSTLDIFLYHTIVTWLIFDFCNVKFVFIFSVFSGIITLFPIITPWIILLPVNVINFIDTEFTFFKICLFNLSYHLIINFVDNDIYKKNVRKSDPYITGLSFVMGMYTFGFKGIIYGPVLLCVSITVSDIIKILIKFK